MNVPEVRTFGTEPKSMSFKWTKDPNPIVFLRPYTGPDEPPGFDPDDYPVR